MQTDAEGVYVYRIASLLVYKADDPLSVIDIFCVFISCDFFFEVFCFVVG